MHPDRQPCKDINHNNIVSIRINIIYYIYIYILHIKYSDTSDHGC